MNSRTSNEQPPAQSFELAGMIASEGAALGQARVLGSVMESVPHRSLMPQEIGPELHRFSDAVQSSRSQMRGLIDAGHLDRELAEIFEAQLLLLEDPMLIDETREKIRSRKLNAEWALAEETASLKEFLLKARNEMVRERAADLEDMSNRILSNLMGVPEGDIRIPALKNLPPGSILIAHDLSPSLMLHIRENCAGIATEAGGVTGHMAILARSRGIPALVHVGGLLDRVADGDALFMEALPDAARLIGRPGPAEEQRFASWQTTRNERMRRLREAGAPESPLTLPDGSHAIVLANLEAVPETAPVAASELTADADESFGRVSGVGLFRTELLYLKDPTLLSDDARHAEVYTRLFRGEFAQRPITLRLLDAGDDKAYPPQAAVRDRDLRGVRFLLANPNILEAQLRAIFTALQASGYTQLRLLVPVVSRPEEMIGVREAIARMRESAAPGLPRLRPPRCSARTSRSAATSLALVRMTLRVWRLAWIATTRCRMKSCCTSRLSFV